MKRVWMLTWLFGSLVAIAETGIGPVERQFRDLPMEARRLTGPLFWLHGTETPAQLETELQKVVEGGNGCFTAESRPHNDWLGEGWYRDLAICLEAAKKRDLKMWIFDERWWPSQGVGGNVPPRYAAKRLAAEAVDVEGPNPVQADGHGGERYIATLAGRVGADGKVDGDSLVDLKEFIKDGKLAWQPPAGTWKIMKFTHVQAPGLGQNYGGRPQLSVDGASRDCTDWFIRTVYQPHFDRFGADFGKTIPGYFYDEPETRGDWGTDLNETLAAWNVDWKKAYVAYKFGLSGESDIAARYQYLDAFAETWGRVMYGGMSDWCRKHGVVSMGHFMEHGALYVHREFCAGDMMRLQKYSDMGGIDLVCRQMYPGQRPHDIYQTPKLGSSISHVFGKVNDIAMCEMFGAYGQDITYPQMKWLTDQMQVRGVNYMIPHSFNPRGPHDTDCPPYFYNGGCEPRYPLYRVYADYTSRLSLMLTGGAHVCPIALLFSGISRQVGKMTTPEEMTSAIQDAVYDCDWLPFEVFEGKAELKDKNVALLAERYQVLIVPPVEVIPHGTLLKAREFFERGGVVLGYGSLPSRSATIGRTAADIAALCDAIWGADAKPGLTACKTSAGSGKSYFLPEKPSAADIAQVLARDAGVAPVVEVLEGDTGNWLHVLHRVKAGRDLFLICNQNPAGAARSFRFLIRAAGEPECWDAMSGSVTAVPYKRVGDRQVEVELALEPSESQLLVFHAEKRALPMRLTAGTQPARARVAVVREATPPELIIPSGPQAEVKTAAGELTLNGLRWVWCPEGNPAASAPPGRRYFRGVCTVPAGRKIKQARFFGTCDNAFTLYVNGREAGKSSDDLEGWRQATRIDLTKLLAEGRNVLAVSAINMSDTASPAGLIGRYEITFEEGAPLKGSIGEGWKAAGEVPPQWKDAAFDDTAWAAVAMLGEYGCGPWGRFAEEGRRGRLTASPVTSDPFVGRCELPADLNPAAQRVYVEMEGIEPEAAARVTVNGQVAGGCIGAPLRVEVSGQIKPGANRIVIEPFAPKSVWISSYRR